MNDPLRSLVHDTLAHIKSLPKGPQFGTSEECVFFKTRPEAAPRVAVQHLPPPPPLPSPKKAEVKEAPLPPQPVKEKPPQEDTSPQIGKILQRIAPSIRQAQTIPDDAQAKRIANSWKERVEADVVLLACDSSLGTLDLLKNLAKAIAQHLGTVKIITAEKIEREKRWDLFLENAFRLLIASDEMQKMPEMMRFYRSLPASSQHFLGEIPLIPLAPHGAYSSVQLKADLWKTLCQLLKK